MKTIQLFCGTCNTETEQQMTAINGEYVATCGCAHTLKFPKVATVDELRAMIAQHNADNKPAVTLAELDTEEQDMLNTLDSL